MLSYNFADGGATTDAKLVKPWKEEVRSFGDQVAQFRNASDAIEARLPGGKIGWGEVLVGVWMGVNDVGNAWWLPADEYAVLVGKVMDGYFGTRGLEGVYVEGARRFVLLGVPREFFWFFLSPAFVSPAGWTFGNALP